jgi:hypothetical protein
MRGETSEQARAAGKLELIDTVFEVIDMRSFSNLWFWIVLAVLWSSTSYWVLGVPFDLIQQARREGGQAQQDLVDLVRINTSRLLMMVDRSGVIGVALLSFWGTGLALLAFYYDVEFAQALFLLLAPLTLVVWQSIRTSRRIAFADMDAEALHRALIRLRRVTQVIGMLAITVTALYGTWQNISVSILH